MGPVLPILGGVVGGTLLSGLFGKAGGGLGLIDDKADYVAQGGPGSPIWNPYTVGTPVIGGGMAMPQGYGGGGGGTGQPLPVGDANGPYNLPWLPQWMQNVSDNYNANPSMYQSSRGGIAGLRGGSYPGQLQQNTTSFGRGQPRPNPMATSGFPTAGAPGGGGGGGGSTGPGPVGNPAPLQYGTPQSGFVANPQLNNFNATAQKSNFNAQAIVNKFRAEAMRNNFQAQAYQNAFRAQQAKLDNSNYGDVINRSMGAAGGQGGVAQGTIGEMGQLGDQLRATLAGNGPSLAQLQLQEATNRNVSQMAGLMAGQRGINPGLANRAIMQQGAQAQQAAVNQSAQLRMAEQLAAQQQLASLLSSQGGLQIGQQQAGIQALGTAGGLQNAQNEGRISNLVQAQGLDLNAILANQQAQMGAQQLNWQSASQNADLAQAAQVLNANVAGQNADLANAAQGMNWQTALNNSNLAQAAQALNAQVSMGNQDARNYAMGLNQQTSSLNANLGLGSNQLNAGLATEQARLAMAAQQLQADLMNNNYNRTQNAQSLNMGRSIANSGNAQKTAGGMMGMIGAGLSGISSIPWYAGGEVHDYRGGGAVPGVARFPGQDRPENDTVHAVMTPGEVVIPLSITSSPDAPERAREFMKAIQKNKGLPVYEKMAERKKKSKNER